MSLSIIHPTLTWLTMPARFEPEHVTERLLWSRLKQFYRTHLPYSRPQLSDLVAVGLATPEDKFVTAVRIRLFNSPQQSVQLLTGLVTHSQYRNQGIASQLMQFIKPELNQSSYLFCPSHLCCFYQEHGYKVINHKFASQDKSNRLSINHHVEIPAIIKQKYNDYQRSQTDLIIMQFTHPQ
ncbi:GNAT family N-acetyltransferase [Shewanella intestini]|uniref:GNAT family N-acetyltransferase n=1 Tax=Shewanella intestini TaxID=2017544 RepID=A0ABS5I6Q3_9GAMM|nr:MULTISPECIES: GNAT family N-acetyltransferase [Shewanella]MBR9729404.1 GNAT family N-acetyltransferase [Shewanella intestini]MRG37484.1 GNAT family N-acetyltransferase [Shewanella sp. XMDDZSB0408]